SGGKKLLADAVSDARSHSRTIDPGPGAITRHGAARVLDRKALQAFRRGPVAAAGRGQPGPDRSPWRLPCLPARTAAGSASDPGHRPGRRLDSLRSGKTA